MTHTKDELIAKLTMRIVYLSLLIIILLGSLVIVYFNSSLSLKGDEVYPTCGVEDDLPYVSYEGESNTEGGKLFKQNCAVCHSMSANKLTGPGLAGVADRVPGGTWLYDYISNSDSLFKTGDPYTRKLREDYPNLPKPVFIYLKREEIEAIINYISKPPLQYTVLP